MREVNRVRGKNILWLCMIAMFLTTMMVNVDAWWWWRRRPRLYIDPYKVPEGWFTQGHPGDVYEMSVKIKDVEDLWTISFEINIAPYVSVLVPSEIREGDFLSNSSAWPTTFISDFDGLYGTISITITRMPISWPPTPNEGMSGDGTLMTFKLTVIEAGVSDIDIDDSVLIDSTGAEIEHRTRDGYYWGCIATFAWWRGIKVPRYVTAGETFNLSSRVWNFGDTPLYVRVRFDIDRDEDGRRIVIRSGQTYTGGGLGEPLPYEYLYLDEFNEW